MGMANEIEITKGLSGADKKLARQFGGVVAYEVGDGQYKARFNQDVRIPSYGGSIIMRRMQDVTDTRHTRMSAAQALFRVTRMNAELGRPFLVHDTGVDGVQSMDQDLRDAGYQEVKLYPNS